LVAAVSFGDAAPGFHRLDHSITAPLPLTYAAQPPIETPWGTAEFGLTSTRQSEFANRRAKTDGVGWKVRR
jgi:hypothetical protein